MGSTGDRALDCRYTFRASCPRKCQDSSVWVLVLSVQTLFSPHNLFGFRKQLLVLSIYYMFGSLHWSLYLLVTNRIPQSCLCNHFEGTVCLSFKSLYSWPSCEALCHLFLVLPALLPTDLPVQKEPCVEGISREQLCFE